MWDRKSERKEKYLRKKQKQRPDKKGNRKPKKDKGRIDYD